MVKINECIVCWVNGSQCNLNGFRQSIVLLCRTVSTLLSRSKTKKKGLQCHCHYNFINKFCDLHWGKFFLCKMTMVASKRLHAYTPIAKRMRAFFFKVNQILFVFGISFTIKLLFAASESVKVRLILVRMARAFCLVLPHLNIGKIIRKEILEFAPLTKRFLWLCNFFFFLLACTTRAFVMEKIRHKFHQVHLEQSHFLICTTFVCFIKPNSHRNKAYSIPFHHYIHLHFLRSLLLLLILILRNLAILSEWVWFAFALPWWFYTKMLLLPSH